MGEAAAWIVDVVGLEEEAYTRLIIHAGLVSGTILVMGYESRANHSRYIISVFFSLDDFFFDMYRYIFFFFT